MKFLHASLATLRQPINYKLNNHAPAESCSARLLQLRARNCDQLSSEDSTSFPSPLSYIQLTELRKPIPSTCPLLSSLHKLVPNPPAFPIPGFYLSSPFSVSPFPAFSPNPCRVLDGRRRRIQLCRSQIRRSLRESSRLPRAHAVCSSAAISRCRTIWISRAEELPLA